MKIYVERNESHPEIRKLIHLDSNATVHRLFNALARSEGFAPATVMEIVAAAMQTLAGMGQFFASIAATLLTLAKISLFFALLALLVYLVYRCYTS